MTGEAAIAARRSAGVSPVRRSAPYEPWLGEAVAAFRGADDRAARSDDLGGGRHALDRLVEVLVEGIAAVGRHDDVEGAIDRLHRLAPRLCAGGRVHGQDLAAECPGDPLLVIEQDVQGEIDAGGRRDRPDRIVDRIALDHAPGGSRIADPPCVVELEGGRHAGQSRGDHLGPTAEPGEEVRFDEARRDPKVRGHPFPVEQDRDISDVPKVDLARDVAGVVVLDSPLREHVVTQHRATLTRGRCAMGAGGDQDDDVLRSDDAVERFHDRPEHEGPGLGSRDVAHGDRDALTRSGDLPERWPGHRLGDRPPQRRRGVRRCCSGPWPDHRGRVRGQLDRQTRRPVGEVHRDPIVPAARLDHSSTTRLPGAVHATVHEHTGAWLIRRLPVIPHAFGTARSRGTDLEHLLGVAVRDPHGSGAGDCSERRAGNGHPAVDGPGRPNASDAGVPCLDRMAEAGRMATEKTTERTTDGVAPVRDLVVEAARTQLAAVSAGIHFWAAWIDSADRYTQAIGAELARLEGDKEPAGDIAARLADCTRAYVRELTTLPAVAVQHFNGELEKIGQPKRRRSRSARVKE